MNCDGYYTYREKIERRERQAAFIEKTYRLGNEINTMIEQQDTGLTQFGITFSEALFNEFGLRVMLCNLSLFFSGICNVAVWYDGRCGICDSDGRLAEQYQKTAEKLFFDSARRHNLPPFPEDRRLEFRLYEFFLSARQNYYSVNACRLNVRLRHKYPEEDVTLLWTYAPHNYVLLFQTPSDIPENAVVAGMKDYVDSMCRENDRLGLFSDYHSSPIVSDFETIRPDLMGILQNNTWYGKPPL